MPAQPPLVILSPEFPSYSRYQIGEHAWQMGQYLKLNIPLPETFLLPKGTVEKIIKANQHRSSMSKLFIPHQIKLEIIRHYHQFLNGDFVRIYADNNPNQSLNNIIGDANLIHSLTEFLQTVIAESVGSSSKQKNLSINSGLKPLPTKHSLLKQSIPNLLITRQPQADVSGVVYTYHPLAFSKSHYLIEAVAGIWTNYPEPSQKDIYQVDIRTQTIINQTKRSKNLSYKREPDGVIPTKPNVPASKLLLSPIALKVLTQLTHNVALHQFKPLKVFFAIKNRRVFIQSIQVMDNLTLARQAKLNQVSKKLPIKINLNLALTNNLAKLVPLPDGIIYSAEQAILSFNTYPNVLIQQKTNRLLRLLLNKQWSRLNYWLKLNPKNQVFVKLTDFTQDQLRNLKQAPDTTSAINPMLGLRGVSQMLLDRRLLEFELSVIKQNWDHSKKLNLILPFVRSGVELEQTIKLIQSLKLDLKLNFWAEIATGHAILTINQWPLRKLSGLLINTKILQASLTGFDPKQHYLNQVYQHQQLGMIKLLKQFALDIKDQPKPVQVMLNLTSYHYQLIELGVKNSWQFATSRFLHERTRLAVTDALERQLKRK